MHPLGQGVSAKSGTLRCPPKKEAGELYDYRRTEYAVRLQLWVSDRKGDVVERFSSRKPEG